MKDCKSKIFKNYLTMCHLSVQEKLKEKRAAISAHREFIKEPSHDLKHVKVQPCVCS